MSAGSLVLNDKMLIEVNLVKALVQCRHSNYTEDGFRLKSGFSRSTQKLVLDLNQDSQKKCLHQSFQYRE